MRHDKTQLALLKEILESHKKTDKKLLSMVESELYTETLKSRVDTLEMVLRAVDRIEEFFSEEETL